MGYGWVLGEWFKGPFQINLWYGFLKWRLIFHMTHGYFTVLQQNRPPSSIFMFFAENERIATFEPGCEG